MLGNDLNTWLEARCDQLEKRLLRRQLLTARQREVLILMAEGKAGKEIAYALSISPKTVECHKSAICGTLGLTGSTHLIRFAVEEGFVGTEAMSDDELRAEIMSLHEIMSLQKKLQLVAPEPKSSERSERQ
jgi:DNA-binding CsgD family transcriptional regulator